MATTGTIKYKLYQANRQDEYNGKWYAKAVQDRTVDFEDFVSHLAAHNSPYSRGVIHGVLMDMLSCLQELVLDGKSVRLGELGLISVGIVSSPAETREGWTVATNLKGERLNVRNTKTWSNAELRKGCKLSELTAYDDGSATTGDEEGTDSPGTI